MSECRATGWISDSAQLAKLMGKIDCRGGNTQIGKVLSEARREAVAAGVRAVVFVGDAMEENVDDLCEKAGELGLLKVPVFMNYPVPNFCLDHRFVRPNYARQRATFRCSETGPERLVRPIGRPVRRSC